MKFEVINIYTYKLFSMDMRTNAHYGQLASVPENFRKIDAHLNTICLRSSDGESVFVAV